MVGPAFVEIANKYSEESIPYLSEKIITGGVGIWGDTPMTPHSEVGKEEAEMMVQYILSQYMTNFAANFTHGFIPPPVPILFRWSINSGIGEPQSPTGVPGKCKKFGFFWRCGS